MSKIAQLLEQHEGRKACAYQDSLGYWTIGVGHLVDSRKNAGLPDPIIDAMLEYDIQEKADQLTSALPWVVSLDEVRHAVLLDMCFNLGIAGLLGFQHFLAAVKSGDYKTAAQQMLQSKWATQVKTRATRLSTMMDTGLWPAGIE